MGPVERGEPRELVAVERPVVAAETAQRVVGKVVVGEQQSPFP